MGKKKAKIIGKQALDLGKQKAKDLLDVGKQKASQIAVKAIGKQATQKLKEIVGQDATQEVKKQINRLPAKELKKIKYEARAIRSLNVLLHLYLLLINLWLILL